MTIQWATMPSGVSSRSINAENFTGTPGQGAKASSNLGPGRKGSAWINIPSGETATLAEIEGPGVIRHIWLTVDHRTDAGPFVLRDLVLRMYWDNSEVPSVEVPLGDFFCNGFAQRALVTSEPIVVAPTGGMNSFIPMPFAKGARITIENQHGGELTHFFYQIDYTVGDDVADAMYFHAQWRRSNGNLPHGEDHVILDGVQGRGSYLGTYVALASLQRYWWGEGEVKFFVDGDTDYPTLCSTGLEDYAGGAWAFQDELRTEPDPKVVTFNAPYFGYPFHETVDRTKAAPFHPGMPPMHGLYRWHIPDPIYFQEQLRVTVQQIGTWDHGGLFERSDDISTTAYWYQDGINHQMPQLPGAQQRWPR
ncbi:hypothetical protein NicSoilE8_42860 (plasmid) [Arthrobacter sp. NicSoilE8]|nr:hypothetical protein NicSoilE8_42860 [Arthrobacter sp. NicSoilE8]